MKNTALVFALTSLLLMPAAFAHGDHGDAFSESGEAKGAKEVEVDEQGIKALGIKLAKVSTGYVDEVLKATGEVKPAETRAFDVTAPIAGSVRQVYASQNDSVRSGQVLATIHSIEVAQMLTDLVSEKTKITSDIEKLKTQYQSEITLLHKELELSSSEYQRQKQLFEEGIAARKTYLQAANEHEKNKVRLATVKTKEAQETALLKKQLQLHIKNIKGQLAIMGIPAASADRALAGGSVTADLAIRSPVSGIVTFREVTLGERVEPSKKLFSVVDLSPIWVVIDVFQEQLPKIRLGQSVKVISPSLQTMQGKISSIDSNVDPIKKTVHVRVVAENQLGTLRPGAFVNAEIVLGSTPSGNIVVPSMAVVESAGKHMVYQRHEKHFEPTEVQIGKETNGKTEIVSGIKPGSEIVVEGARQLLAQGMLKARAEEHEGPGHDEHDAHGEHEETMEHATKPEVSMITMFMAGLATACAAIGSIFLIRMRFRKKTTIVREKPKEKIKGDGNDSCKIQPFLSLKAGFCIASAGY